MSVSVEVPSLGESVTEAYIAKWNFDEGEFVEEDKDIVELETDKITVSVPAPVSGTLQNLKGNIDDVVEVGDIIAEIEPGEQKVEAEEAEEEPAGQEAEESTEAEPEQKAEAAEQPTEAESEQKTEAAKEPVEHEGLMPSVRRLVEEHNLDPDDIEGPGPGGRILKGDVLSYIEQGDEQPAETKETTTPITPDQQEERVRMSKLRQTVAQRLTEVQQEAAILTTFNEVDMSRVMELRSKYKNDFAEKYDRKLGFMSFFVKAVIEALKEYPVVNAEIDGDEIVYKNYYNIGVAVGSDEGLVVPVIDNADQLSFAEVEDKIAELAGKVMDNRITVDELQGGTFTISNGGIYGSMLSTPILNPPQSGILGMHNIVERPVAIDGEVEIRPIMYLALSYDHRIIDGKEAVSFLNRVKECIENPERILLEI